MYKFGAWLIQYYSSVFNMNLFELIWQGESMKASERSIYNILEKLSKIFFPYVHAACKRNWSLSKIEFESFSFYHFHPLPKHIFINFTKHQPRSQCFSIFWYTTYSTYFLSSQVRQNMIFIFRILMHKFLQEWLLK